jgi:hypothetical protein
MSAHRGTHSTSGSCTPTFIGLGIPVIFGEPRATATAPAPMLVLATHAPVL